MRIYLILALVILNLASCSLFLEENLEEEDVIILSPADNDTSIVSTKTFWWEELRGVSDYRIQIVTPNFNQVKNLILDTMIDDNKFILSLQPGSYQWRIRGENGSSVTDYIIRSFVIDSTQDLALQTLPLINPADNIHLNSTEVDFSWQGLYNADDYRFQIAVNSFAAGNPILYDESMTSTSISLVDFDEGTYQWRVRAQNNFSNSLFSTRTFTIDTTRPAPPSQLLPGNNITVSSPVQLSWTRDNGVISDSVFIYSDSTFSAVIEKRNLSSSNFNFTIGITGEDYFWFVKSIDKAGNISDPSLKQRFIIQ